MNYKIMRSILTICLFFFIGNIYSQCCCARFTLKIKVQDTTIAHYDINVFEASSMFLGWDKVKFNTKIKNDSLIIHYPTGCGKDSLIFSIENENKGILMKIKIKNISYDTPYLISLKSLKSGLFCLDWNKIFQCYQGIISNNTIICGKKKLIMLQQNISGQFKFYQVELPNIKEWKL